MIFSLPFKTSIAVDVGLWNLTAGCLVLGPQIGVQDEYEVRLVRLDLGGESRVGLDIPGFDWPADFNVGVGIKRWDVNTPFNPEFIPGDPSNLPVSGIVHDSSGPVSNVSVGFWGTSLLPAADPGFDWRFSFQIRRGFKKRWAWSCAPVIHRAEYLTMFLSPLAEALNYYPVIRGTMEFATSPEDMN